MTKTSGKSIRTSLLVLTLSLTIGSLIGAKAVGPQTPKQRDRKAPAAPPAPKPDPAQIVKNYIDRAKKETCECLEKIITEANNATSPTTTYFELRVADDFVDTCVNGELIWQALRKTTADDTYQDNERRTVKMKFEALNMIRSQANDRNVELRTDKPAIEVTGYEVKLDEYWLDLRESRYSDVFVKVLKEFASIVAAEKEWKETGQFRPIDLIDCDKILGNS